MTLKKTFKQVLAGSLAAVTLFSLTACGGSEEKDTVNPVDTTVSTEDKRHEIEGGFVEEETVVTEPVVTEPVVLPDEELPYDQRSYYHNKAHFESSYLSGLYTDFDAMTYEAKEDDTTRMMYAGQDVPENFALYGAYFDENGRFYVDGFDDYVELPEDLMGEICGAYYSNFSGEVVAYSMTQDGTVYLNVFDPDGTRNAPYGYNDVVYVEYGDDDIRIDKFKAVAFDRKASGNMSDYHHFLVADEGIFYSNINLNFRNSFSSKHVKASLEDMFAPSLNGTTSPLFKQNGDMYNLYYKYYKDELQTMVMPEGYTIDDIKDVFFFDNAVVVFNDNTVYWGEVTEWRTTLELHEELTGHMQNGNVLGMYNDTYNVIVDMVNGCSYKFSPEGDSYSYW